MLALQRIVNTKNQCQWVTDMIRFISRKPESVSLCYCRFVVLVSTASPSKAVVIFFEDRMATSLARLSIRRTFATLTRNRLQPVTYSPEGAVTISYPTLRASPLLLQESIGKLSLINF